MCLGIPGRIVEIYDVAGLKMGKVDFNGVIREACLEYIPDAVIGDYTVVHVGFAISRIDEAEALWNSWPRWDCSRTIGARATSRPTGIWIHEVY